MAASARPLTADEILDQFKDMRLKARTERESSESISRQGLRDSVVQLREPSPRAASSPAVASQPSFKIGDAKGFSQVAEQGETHPGRGHLSEPAATEFFDHMKDAAKRPDAASRDAATDRAAKTVAHDWANKHGIANGKEGVLAVVLHEARAQAAFASREIGKAIGVGPVESSVIGYSLERALEKEGFKVFANHAIDKSADLFRASASSVSQASGLRHAAEQSLSKSMNWLSSHGVTRDALKEALGKHAGKLLIVAEVSHHPEVVQKVAYALSKSEGVVSGAVLLAKDSDFRKAVGTMAVSGGEVLAGINKGAGAIAIVAGSALRGDSNQETARHAFRAALTVLGGAAGGMAGAGVASVATGTAGAMAGSWAADKLLEIYDKHLGGAGRTRSGEPLVAKQELNDSAQVIGNRVGVKLKEAADSGRLPAALAERTQGLEREYSMHKPAPTAKS